jgi:hypothetical protein
LGAIIPGIGSGGRIPRNLSALWIGYVAVVLLLLVHANLMATGECAALMGSMHGPATGRQEHGAARNATPGLAASPHRPAPPPAPSPAGACPAQQALLPLLALILALLLAALGGPSRIPASGPPGRVPGEPTRPPPLSARRRRALLQVFLN